MSITLTKRRFSSSVSASIIAVLIGSALSIQTGCSSTASTTHEDHAVSTSARSISQEEALADFDRVWELVNETHFDPTFNGVDWEAVGEEYRPKAQSASSRRELRMVIQSMLGELGQSHFGIIPSSAADANPEQQDAGSATQTAMETDADHTAIPTTDRSGEMNAQGYREITLDKPVNNGDGEGDADTGIDVRILDGHAVVSAVREASPAADAGVKTGWILSRIRNREVDRVLEQLGESLTQAELGIHAVSLLKDRMMGREGTPIELTFLDGTDQPITLEIDREPLPGEFVKFGNLPPMSTHLDWTRHEFTNADGTPVSVGIIRFNIFMIPIAPKFERAMYELRDCDGIVIDLRGNPGGVGALSSALGRFLVSEPGSLGTMTMRGAELQFNIEPVIVTTWGEPLKPFAGPIAILQDSGSASTSEVFAGGLQSLGRVKVFGTRSAGMALPASMDRLPSGDVLLHAIADFVSSTGARMEDGGVIPDYEVPLTREDLLRGIDSPEHAAEQWISDQISNQ